MGRSALPAHRRPRDRRHRRGRGLGRHRLEGRRPRGRGLHGQFLRRVRGMRRWAGAELPERTGRHVQRRRRRRHDHSGRIRAEGRRQRTLRVPDPRRPRLRRRGPAAVRGHHHLCTAQPLGRRREEERRAEAGRRARTRRTRPYGRADRRGHGRRGDRALAHTEEGSRGTGTRCEADARDHRGELLR